MPQFNEDTDGVVEIQMPKDEEKMVIRLPITRAYSEEYATNLFNALTMMMETHGFATTEVVGWNAPIDVFERCARAQIQEMGIDMVSHRIGPSQILLSMTRLV